MMASVSPDYVCGWCFAEGAACMLAAFVAVLVIIVWVVPAILLAVDWVRGR
jgi:hypothetical protein